MKFKLKSKVKLSRQKADGSFNYGTIIGIELLEDNFYLGYKNEKEYLNRFKGKARYKVLYIDNFTKRAIQDWFSENEIEKK